MNITHITPEDAYRLLKEGNERFVNNASRRPNQGRDRRTETSLYGQHPYATVLACSDSRVPVELLCDAGIGDIFVVRTAGNIMGPSETGSVEYAIEHLNTPIFVVMSHSKCGAVSAVVKEGLLEGVLRPISEKIYPAVSEAKQSSPHLSEEQLTDVAAKLNMWNAIKEAYEQSSCMREKVKEGTLKVIGAFYDIDTGVVDWLGPHLEEERIIG